MKLHIFYLISFTLLIFTDCTTKKWGNYLISTGDIDDAINNSIIDFVNTSKIYKQDSIFDLVIQEKEELLIISIGRAINKIYYNSDNKPGSYDENFPTAYKIINNKLFYWNNPKIRISQEVISALDDYNHIDYNWSEEYIIPPYTINDAQESVIYYVCKNNFKNYKKMALNTFNKHNKIPKLNCNK